VIAEVGDLALPVGVGDLPEHARGVELLRELAGPQRRVERAAVGRTGVGVRTGGGVELDIATVRVDREGGSGGNSSHCLETPEERVFSPSPLESLGRNVFTSE